ncbi:MAG: 50S ribosomal protein L33 [Dehalococcoidia bacterium]|nr:50S ribosomal protein L33 [Dehalococcoidia bacterium]MQG09430.1 50S ribosomal protein L33 [SAR202 cluster bacterium]
MAKKSAVRTLVEMICTNQDPKCKPYSYHTEKNRRNTPDRIELKKFCPCSRNVQVFKEKR